VVAVASKKKPKVEARSQRGNRPEEPIGAEAAGKKAKAVKAASKKAANKKAASKKTSNKKTAGKKNAASKDAVSTRTKAGKKTKKVPSAPAAGAWDPFEVAKQTMKGSVPAIVKAMVEKAKQGSCTHAKTLLEMTGAKHMFDEVAETANSGEPWAKLVLERMDEAEQENLTQDTAKGAAEP
jgi:hypothetical protein